MTSDSNDCPILTDATTFQIWKVRVVAELRDKKVWGLVNGSEVDPGPNVTIYPSYYQGTDSWDIRDGKAHSIIVKQLSNALIFKHVLTPQTSKELWESIMTQFEEQNMGISALYTYAEIMSLKWDGSSDIHEHISKVRSAER
ncbi:hypothetical protein K439DRAFT_1623112 [Ramaria rubella]|nr:hypothetical protein K439DRAFT_1623112 [Ramaria rubella]